jgi:alpha-beta hydrolase superfamily lysophospholipase
MPTSAREIMAATVARLESPARDQPLAAVGTRLPPHRDEFLRVRGCLEFREKVVRVRAILVVAIVLAQGCLADKLLLFPQRGTAPPGATVRKVGTLEVVIATSAPGSEPAAFVLRFYGNAQLANDIAYEAAQFRGQAIEWWGVNYPGFGGSAGPATLARVASSARAVYDALAKRATGRPIVVIGTSLGTAAALHVAAHAPVAGLVLHNPPPLAELVMRRYGWWNLWLVALPTAVQIPEELDSVANAARVGAPALVLSSTDDGVVPPRYQDLIMRAYAGDWELVAMPGGHNAPLPDWVIRKLVTWVRTRTRT